MKLAKVTVEKYRQSQDMSAGSARKQITIWEALRAKLGRDPTRAELKADWERILKS